MRIRYAVDDTRITGVTDYYYELPTRPRFRGDVPNGEEILAEDFELVEAKDGLWNNDWVRLLTPDADAEGGVRGDGGFDDDFYYEEIAHASRRTVAEYDRKVWAAMEAAGIRR